MKRILIIQTAFIGDVILATSLLETLHNGLKGDCSVDFLVRKGNEVLLKDHPYVNEVYVWNKKQKKYVHLFKVIRELRNTTYDSIYNLQRFGATGFVTWRLKAKNKVGFAKNPFAFSFDRKIAHEIGNGKHEVERNFELIRSDLPEASPLFKPKLYPSKSDFDQLLKLGLDEHSYFVLAPASVWYTKQLPLEKWIDLIRYLGSEKTIYLIGAPGDKVLIDTIIETSGQQNCINLAGQLNLLQSAALISRAQRAYVNDSAPLHLASATNAPVTAFFCSTVASFGFGPLSDDSVVLETQESLDCRPCGLHGHKSCPKGHFKCGKTIIIER